MRKLETTARWSNFQFRLVLMGWTTPATGIRCANEAGEEQDVVRAGESLGDIGGKVLGVGPQRDLVQAHGQANRTRMVCDHFRRPFTINSRGDGPRAGSAMCRQAWPLRIR